MKKSPKKYKVENTYRSDIKFNTTNYKKETPLFTKGTVSKSTIFTKLKIKI